MIQVTRGLYCQKGYPFAFMRRLNMPVEQKTRLMCSWLKGIYSQAFGLEVEGNSCLEGEAIEHSGTEMQQMDWQHPGISQFQCSKWNILQVVLAIVSKLWALCWSGKTLEMQITEQPFWIWN